MWLLGIHLQIVVNDSLDNKKAGVYTEIVDNILETFWVKVPTWFLPTVSRIYYPPCWNVAGLLNFANCVEWRKVKWSVLFSRTQDASPVQESKQQSFDWKSNTLATKLHAFTKGPFRRWVHERTWSYTVSHCHLDKYPENLGDTRDNQGGYFHQNKIKIYGTNVLRQMKLA